MADRELRIVGVSQSVLDSIDSVCRAFDRDRSAVVNEILNDWDRRKLMEATMRMNLYRGNGGATAPQRQPIGNRDE